MHAFVGNKQVEAYEWITNRDLVDSAHLLMGGIDLIQPVPRWLTRM